MLIFVKPIDTTSRCKPTKDLNGRRSSAIDQGHILRGVDAAIDTGAALIQVKIPG
jgi:hypothetical protein